MTMEQEWIIAAALKRGQQIDGCQLVERRSWSIK